MARRKNSKKINKSQKINLSVLSLFIIGIILSILIYTRAGIAGDALAQFLRWNIGMD